MIEFDYLCILSLDETLVRLDNTVVLFYRVRKGRAVAICMRRAALVSGCIFPEQPGKFT